MTMIDPRFSTCLELLFVAEATAMHDRIRLAHAAYFRTVEFWRWSNKNLDEVDAALLETGVDLAAILAEPVLPLTDLNSHARFLEGLSSSVDVARRLGAGTLIVQAGNLLDSVPRVRQSEALVDGLRKAASVVAGTGIVLALEPLNIRVDHPGYFLSSTVEGLDIVDAVGCPEVRLLYDIYHSHVMGEDPAAVLAGRVDRVRHVHLADAPGRHEPGTGEIDWRSVLNWLRANGYAGPVGLEYRPSVPTLESLRSLA